MAKHSEIDHTGITGVGGSLTVQEEGVSLATAASTLNFVGAGVTATGAGATKTITIPGASGGADPQWTIQLLPFLYKATTGFGLASNDDTFVLGIAGQSSGAQNDEISWDIVLGAGTYTFSILHHQSTNRGIYSVRLDGVEQGTVDGYNGSPTANVRSTVTGIVVATTQKYTFALRMAAKHASSSAYYASFSMCQWHRTA